MSDIEDRFSELAALGLEGFVWLDGEWWRVEGYVNSIPGVGSREIEAKLVPFEWPKMMCELCHGEAIHNAFHSILAKRGTLCAECQERTEDAE